MGLPHSEEHVTAGLVAVAANAGNCAAAARSITMEEHGFTVSAGTLSIWVNDVHSNRYLDIRDKYREQLEQQLANKQTDAAAQATETALLAIEKAKTRLELGKDDDPAKTAANLSTAADKMMRGSLTLQNRPSTIKETRNPIEMMRSLIGRGVFKIDGDVLQAPWLESGEPVQDSPDNPDPAS